jgi:hypothetical protein
MMKIYVGNIIRTKDTAELVPWCRNKKFEVLRVDGDMGLAAIWIPTPRWSRSDESTWATVWRRQIAEVVGDSLQVGDIIHTYKYGNPYFEDQDWEVRKLAAQGHVYIPRPKKATEKGADVLLDRKHISHIVRKAGDLVIGQQEATKPKGPMSEDDEDFEKAMAFFGRHKKHKRGNSGLEFL